MLVLVKLVLPTSLSSPVSLGYWFGEELRDVKVIDTVAAVYLERATQVTQVQSIEVKGEVSAVAAAGTSDEPIVTEAVGPPVVSVTTLTWEAVLFLFWLTVVVMMGGLLIQRAVFVSGLVFQAKSAGSLMTGVFEYCCGQMGLKGKVGLKVSAKPTSPAVCGLFRPVILVPGDLAPRLGASRLRAVLLHELAHIKRGDLWVSLAQTVLQILYFYNPLLWAANFVVRRVREQAVDEAVQVVMGEKAREYPQTLVEVAKLAFKRPTLSLRFIGVVESKSALKGRVKRMLGRPVPRSAKLGVAGLLAVIVVGAVLLPMAGAEKNNKATENTEATEMEGDSKKFKATLSNGVTVELVGVCEYPSEGKQWWRPDGDLRDGRPYNKTRGEYIIPKDNDETHQSVEFAVKISHPGYKDVSTQIVVPTATSNRCR
jgi:beta-lactamase regulating signal transducer with metallopeptidase domain